MPYGYYKSQTRPVQGIPQGDDFASGSSDFGARNWLIYDPNTNLVSPTVDTESGSFDFDINAGGSGTGAFWFDDQDGPVVYRLATGSLRMTCQISVQNTGRTGLPTLVGPHFRICGLTAQDPAGLVSGSYNYEHVGYGGTATGNAECEYKDTIDSVTGSTPGNSMPGFGSTTIINPAIVQGDRIEGELLLQRNFESVLSDTWTMAFREVGGSSWTVIHNASRPSTNPLPPKLAWGMMCYSSSTTHGISGTFSSIQFSAAAPVT